MPELPDVKIYLEHLEKSVKGRALAQIRLRSIFLLRSVTPPLSSCHGKVVTSVRRLGKQIVIGLEDELFLLIHLMISGRLRWGKPDAAIPKGMGLAAFDFDNGTVLFTEASKKKRASLRVIETQQSLVAFDRGGLEVLDNSFEAFAERMRAENHTLKRALTDQRILSGIGNAYSDEILHRARLSPARRTQQVPDNIMRSLHEATRSTLIEWTERLRVLAGDKFPDKVTAFREEMAVHGK